MGAVSAVQPSIYLCKRRSCAELRGKNYKTSRCAIKEYKGCFTGLGGKFYIRYEYENSRTRVQGEIYKNVSQRRAVKKMYCDGVH